MGTWMNSDGLYIRLGVDEGKSSQGGEYAEVADGLWVGELVIPYTDILTATATIPSSEGGFGFLVPAGLRIEKVITTVETAFTSSGAIGSSTLVVGLKKASDRTTALDHAGLTSTGATGTNLSLNTVGAITEVTGSTATTKGGLIGTTLAENGVLVVANSAHATNPFTAGSVRIKVVGRYR